MRRRLDLAMTLVGEPRLIFLDEPTTGLDPRSRRTMWQIIRDLVAAGVTIFLTTQNLEEADQLAGRIAVLDHGGIVAQGSAAELKRRVPGGHVRLHFASARDLDAAARTVGAAVRDDAALTLQVPGDGDARSLRDLLNQLDRGSVEVDRLSIHTPDLDDVFLALTGQPPAAQPASPGRPGRPDAPHRKPAHRKPARDNRSVVHSVRFGHHAAPPPAAHAALPVHARLRASTLVNSPATKVRALHTCPRNHQFMAHISCFV